MRLGADLHEKIAGMLDAPTRVQYAGAHPALGRALRHAMLTDEFVRHAPHVQSLDQMNQLLAAILSQSSLPQRPAALAALGASIDALPRADRAGAFRTLHQAIGTLDARSQGQPLVDLARRVGLLPDSERPDAIAQMLNAQGDLPELHRAAILVVVGHEVRWLPENHSEPAANAVLDAAADLPPQQFSAVVASLAISVRANTPAAHRVYQRLLAVTEQMEPSHRRPALVALGENPEWLPEADRARAFAHLLEMTFDMPVPTRRDPVAALASQVDSVPQPQRTALFRQLREAIAQLPVAHRTEPAMRLTHRIASLDIEERYVEFHRLSQLVRQSDSFSDRGNYDFAPAA